MQLRVKGVCCSTILLMLLGLAHSTLAQNAPSTPAITAPFTPEASLAGTKCGGGTPDSPACTAPYPMLSKGHPVDWWFVFKFNASTFSGCSVGATRACPFGGDPFAYKSFGQQFAYASSEAPTLQQGAGCAGVTGASTAAPVSAPAPATDPIGATFEQVYNGAFHYVVWNDQFYQDPPIKTCSGNGCDEPWGHSKGLVAWNDAGEGLVMQVSTPSWPASGSARFPRKTEGNTLGCLKKDDNIEVSQHFFALRLSKADLMAVLAALGNSSVVTDAANAQVVSNGGPPEVQQLVAKLGQRSTSTALMTTVLSSGVELISKPSQLPVPPWQLVSSVLGGVSLRVASWWDTPQIYSTTATTAIACWSPSLASLPKPGAVEIALSGQWAGKPIGLSGGSGPNFNHAKLGVSTSGDKRYAIFGDMNQQGAIAGPKCDRSQDGRGGMFFVMVHPQLADSIASLITGTSAPTEAPAK